MINLTDKQIIEFFHKSYTSLDGLWFMKIEEHADFDTALEIDNNVWKIMPKIQARMLKSLVKTGNEFDALLECLTTRLSLEGFSFNIESNVNNFSIIIDKCPWHNLLIKAKRQNLSAKIGSVVCSSEYRVSLSEFGDNINFKIGDQICKGSKFCILNFSR